MKHLRSIFKPLWLLREEVFIAPPGLDIEAGEYARLTVIPAPGFFLPPVLFVASTIVYAAAFWSAAWSFAGGGSGGVLLPAGLLGANAAVRGSMKYRERVAALAEWDTPVARERWAVRVAMGAAGLGAGTGAGMLLIEGVPGLAAAIVPSLLVGLLGIAECARNVTRLRGTWLVHDFDLSEHVKYYRVVKP